MKGKEVLYSERKLDPTLTEIPFVGREFTGLVQKYGIPNNVLVAIAKDLDFPWRDEENYDFGHCWLDLWKPFKAAAETTGFDFEGMRKLPDIIENARETSYSYQSAIRADRRIGEIRRADRKKTEEETSLLWKRQNRRYRATHEVARSLERRTAQEFWKNEGPKVIETLEKGYQLPENPMISEKTASVETDNESRPRRLAGLIISDFVKEHPQYKKLVKEKDGITELETGNAFLRIKLTEQGRVPIWVVPEDAKVPKEGIKEQNQVAKSIKKYIQENESSLPVAFLLDHPEYEKYAGFRHVKVVSVYASIGYEENDGVYSDELGVLWSGSWPRFARRAREHIDVDDFGVRKIEQMKDFLDELTRVSNALTDTLNRRFNRIK